MYAYLVSSSSPMHNMSWRVGSLHAGVFEGGSYYLDNTPADEEEVARRRSSSGRPTSSRRDLVHIIRSGAYVPDVFWVTGGDFVVSPRVQQRLAKCKGCIDYKEVVFEKLVDVPMPALGDFSWYESEECYRFHGYPEEYFKSLPHVPAFEDRFRGYKQLDARFNRDVAAEFNDLRPYRVRLRSYCDENRPTKVHLSKAALREYPVIWDNERVFREDAFAQIAPFLDLDYFLIDRIKVTS